MFSKQISLGQIITIVTISFSLFFALGQTSNSIENIEKENDVQTDKINKNSEKVRDIELDVVEIKTLLSDRFDKLEDLIIDN